MWDLNCEIVSLVVKVLGPVYISDKASYCKISQSLEAARFVFRVVGSLWSLTGTTAAMLPTCLSNFKLMRQFKWQISRLQDFTRSHDKTSYRILKRNPDLNCNPPQIPSHVQVFYISARWWCHTLTYNLINIDTNNGLLSDTSKPLLELILVYHSWCHWRGH